MKFADLLLHAQTKATLLALQKQPPHGLLLVGPAGAGKFCVAQAWAEAVLSQPVADIRVIAPDEKGTISIDSIRGLYAATRSKHTGQRAIIIDQADAMGAEAQNALLKLLEEPLPGNIIILTSPATTSLLPTIVSRTQVVAVNPLGQVDSSQLIQKLGVTDQKQAAQLLFIAGGRPGELTRLATDKQYCKHQLELVHLAKSLIQLSPFERLAAVQELAKDRIDCLRVLAAMEQIVIASMKRSSDPRPLVNLAQQLEIASQRIVQNGNTRAQLLALFTSY